MTFGGLACAGCHSREIDKSGERRIIPGSGNARLDIIGFGEAFKNAVQNPALTAEGILDVYEERCGSADGILAKAERFLELNFLRFWLSGIRAELTASASKYDTAPPPNQIQNSEALPAGPSRTRAFRSVLRESMDLPGEGNFAFSKIPSTFYQSSKLCGQFDGSICDHVTRSLIAAYSSGGSIAELAQPDVVHNIVEAAKYTLDLLPASQDAAYAALFPDRAPGKDEASRQAIERGGAVYRQHCASCHGMPTPDGWAFVGEQPHRPITPLTVLGTDPVRLEFRYAASLPDAIWLAFPLPPGDARDQQLKRLETRIADAAAAGYGEDAALWQKLAARFEGAARRHPLGHPLAFDDGTLLYAQRPGAARLSEQCAAGHVPQRALPA
ncbi:MAG: cytochrome c [Rhodomicrobium sp.]|nr:cytochrome c [Rhodomicrobium sp.]